MSPQAWAAVIAALGILLSIGGAAVVVSYRVGKIEAELRSAASSVAATTAAAVSSMAERLARIEGMFELRLRDMPGTGGDYTERRS
jgi:hypothetical protein